MSKTAVIYWSGTGNTEAMAKEVAESVICNEMPDAEAVEKCRALGASLA